MISISIVSHGHGRMVESVVSQLLNFPEVSEIFVTKNIPEDLILPDSKKIVIVDNPKPRGFGHNHNNNFYSVKNEYFCPLNPDVSFANNPFPTLLHTLSKFGVDLVAPLILNNDGAVEDSARNFPSFAYLFNRVFGFGLQAPASPAGQDVSYPDWIGGMFMLFRSDAFRVLGGFDERYFLYYEDVDICTRLWGSGFKLLVNPAVWIVHDARRSSHSSFKYATWHLVSMVRYFVTHWGRLPKKSE